MCHMTVRWVLTFREGVSEGVVLLLQPPDLALQVTDVVDGLLQHSRLLQLSGQRGERVGGRRGEAEKEGDVGRGVETHRCCTRCQQTVA